MFSGGACKIRRDSPGCAWRRSKAAARPKWRHDREVWRRRLASARRCAKCRSSENREAVDFAHRLMTGQIDIMIFMTGVGMRHLLAEVERHVDRSAVSRRAGRHHDDRPRAQAAWPCCSELGLQAHASRARAEHLARSAGDDRRSMCRRPADGRRAGIRACPTPA